MPTYHSMAAFTRAWQAEVAAGREVWRRTLTAHGLDEIAIDRVLTLLDQINTRRMTEVLDAMAAAIAVDDGVTTLPPNVGIDQARVSQELEAFTAAIADLTGPPRRVH